MAMPSNVLVPRPTSSRMTSESRRGLVENLGGLDHLDHEGGLSGGEVVLGADAAEDAVEERQFGRGGRDERARLRHQGDECDLAEDRLISRSCWGR